MFSSYRLIYGSSRHFLGSASLIAGYGLYRGLANPQKIKTEALPGTKWVDNALPTEQLEKRDTKTAASGKTLKSGDSDGLSPGLGNDDSWAWENFSNKLSNIGSSIGSVKWSELPDKVTDLIVPTWLQTLPESIRKLQREVDMGPGSLADEIWAEAADTTINPEIAETARVSIGNDLSPEEISFREQRRLHTRHALAHYLEIPVGDIHPDDVPTIAICGSGGGLRALVAGASSYACARQAGLFDCAMYTAGVSGSCWLQCLYFSSLGKQNYRKVLKHLKHRLGIHLAFPPPALRLLTSAPTNKFLLSGFIEKSRGDPEADFGLVDIYGTLLAARLLVPKGELEIDPMDLKISNQRRYIDSGLHPMPIYTMVRHEIPPEHKDKPIPSEERSEELEQQTKTTSWFSWWEISPYNVWCEEIGAGIPTWSLGRPFHEGVSQPGANGLALPEVRIPMMLGVFGSAFCATLSHYYKEIRPVIKGITGFGGLDTLLSGRDDDLYKVHPIDPAAIPNFALGLDGRVSETCPKSIFTSTHLKLMDAGMSNNLPIYPLLRPGRDIDILIAFDASADIKTENWLSVADGYVKQRSIKGWPVGIGWPRGSSAEEQTVRELDQAQASTPDEASQRVAEAKTVADDDLSYCTVWIGSATERSTDTEQPISNRIRPDSDLDISQSGLAIIYFPLLPNDKVPGIHPDKSDFMSTWNFIYTPEEIDQVTALAQANFEEGREQTKRCVKAIYERKKKLRLAKEDEEEKEKWRRRFKGNADHFR
ncbi:MAG: hypothetical protein GOMPHAMPRED_001152 [Gomphillus americanus]|uniref:Lysophospholipase n=1 Tax=Gomphillus americanus TaxID=1940652 RepID=A0A8H3F7C1_9LECA|nr:MAG: hypothetical protein GOMPHAMPRED_001152 [Gomphillus americanus]